MVHQQGAGTLQRRPPFRARPSAMSAGRARIGEGGPLVMAAR